MASPKDDDRDEEWFKEVYGKEYTGPTNPREDGKDPKKRAPSNPVTTAGESDEEEHIPDPNAVPTDFTSREAKVWEAKAKAIERNWKRRKEEELTCRICGETGHFPQGCPSTLGVNRKSREVVETIPVREKRLKPRIIGTGGSVIQSLEKDTGCRLRLEDSHSGGSVAFTVRVTGPDRLTVNKAVDFLNNFLNQLEDDPKPQSMRGSQSSYVAPAMNPIIAAQMQHIERLQQNSNVLSVPGQSDLAHANDSRAGKERFVSHSENHRMWDGGSPRTLNGSSGSFSVYSLTQGRDSSAVGNLSSFNGKGPGITLEERGLYNHDQGLDRRILHGQLDYLYGQEKKQEVEVRFDELHLPQTLEELERMFMFETRQLTQDQNAEEDKERARHHERMREIHEYYQQKLSSLRAKQLQQRDDFLQNEHLRKQQFQQSEYSHHVPSIHSYGGSPFEHRGHNDQLGYSTGNDPYQGGDQHQDFSGYAYGRKRGASQSYGKNQAYDSPSYPHDEPQHYPPYR
ncbi:hypothetical protein O6H91_23G021200 [Diphasiastrum complanatum]|uniref:Uncharacterized protein n=6 Tax=Diphasiastrum complanatum TaxID=34168 RepID=A0ACC2A8S8_DIPCM|nr:hypothetical protein O6H91_23G021200 [Diphasiastrum complanatum]KAJ7513969.1 hypothetical protein O6H91_23G021200 [Diphasiastrum complanatum]KAJ7513970.1 hypothetical protein O6H91_23G021200 [Diphasiastrum complanatum]KAJ7513971.1 hypothetical protein O6H91_23G021200 [Diphasiastrum complanatum]KAJ7513972.1 hypothetical protein O6H91_23G021200 [Diphasiastrum complanatum]